MPLTLHTPLSAEARRELELELAPLTSLQDVVRWAFSLQPARDVLNVVVQDEFTHDVVLQRAPGVFLVFDTT